MSEQIEKICYELAQELFPKPAWPQPWCDDGWGGIDMNLVKERWRLKAALIKKALKNPLAEAELYKAQYVKASEACAFIRDEQDELGLRIGQCIILDGVPALKRQRDALREEVRRLKAMRILR